MKLSTHKCLLIAALITCAPIISSASELEETQLPELQGFYSVFDTSSTRYASFQLDRIPTRIYNVWIRLSGSANVGEYSCYFYSGFPEGPYPYPVDFFATIQDTVNGRPWIAERVAPEETGDFELTIPFQEIYGWPVTWDFLKSGRGTVKLAGGTIIIVAMCCPDVFPDATVTEAVLIVEADFQVPVDQSTWGSIKSLLR